MERLTGDEKRDIKRAYAIASIGLFGIDAEDLRKLMDGRPPKHSMVASFCWDLAEAMFQEEEKRYGER